MELLEYFLTQLLILRGVVQEQERAIKGTKLLFPILSDLWYM